jgi:hypothetical protein
LATAELRGKFAGCDKYQSIQPLMSVNEKAKKGVYTRQKVGVRIPPSPPPYKLLMFVGVQKTIAKLRFSSARTRAHVR